MDLALIGQFATSRKGDDCRCSRPDGALHHLVGQTEAFGEDGAQPLDLPLEAGAVLLEGIRYWLGSFGCRMGCSIEVHVSADGCNLPAARVTASLL